MYDHRSVELMFGEKETTRKSICYARVSSQKQKQDLDRQRQLLHAKYPDYELVSDIGSGLNYDRPEFKRVLESIMAGEVEELVVASKDRLCRYGFELMEQICKSSDTNLVVLFDSGDSDNELGEDLLAIANEYVAKNNGKRATSYRQQKSHDKTQGRANKENSQLPKRGAKRGISKVDENCETDL